MRDTTFYEQILGLEKPWKVDRVELSVQEGRVDVWLEHSRGAKWPCPQCEAALQCHDHAPERTWRHMDTCQFQTLIHARIPRVACERCGVHQVRVPWAEPHSRFTLLMEAWILQVLQQTETIQSTCELCGIGWESCQRIMKKAVNRAREQRETPVYTRIGVDEKGWGYKKCCTVVCDLDEGTVEEVIPGNDTESLKAFYDTLDEIQLEGIEAVSMDMWKAYIRATTDAVPQGAEKIVFDRFHIMQNMNKALNEVRKQEHRALLADGCDALKGAMYNVLRSKENVTHAGRVQLREMQRMDLKTARAWRIKEALRHLWSYTTKGWAKRFFERWYSWAIRSRLPQVKRVAKMLKNHLKNVLTYFEHFITNALAESLNSRIETILRQARGFRSFDNLRTSILFYCGGLNITP